MNNILKGMTVAAMLAAPALAVAQKGAAGEAPKPTPIGNPGDWVSNNDYPAAASAAGQQGRTEFALDVDAKGRVTGCRIIVSSGSPLLDNTTCSAMVVNARFKPAHAADGKAVGAPWQSAMEWKLNTIDTDEP